MLERAGCPVRAVARPWTRNSRHFVQIQLDVEDIAALPKCPVVSWSIYSLGPHEDGLRYLQIVGAPSGGDVPGVNWSGDELVAFRVHVPSRIRHHNVKRVEDGEDGTIGRGNILSWEQTLADRRAGKPVAMEIWMDAESILYRTLWLFLGALGAALATLATIVWLVRRKGRT